MSRPVYLHSYCSQTFKDTIPRPTSGSFTMQTTLLYREPTILHPVVNIVKGRRKKRIKMSTRWSKTYGYNNKLRLVKCSIHSPHTRGTAHGRLDPKVCSSRGLNPERELSIWTLCPSVGGLEGLCCTWSQQTSNLIFQRLGGGWKLWRLFCHRWAADTKP